MAETDAAIDRRLFDSYLAKAAGRSILLEQLALRTRSMRIRELLAYAATAGTHTLANLSTFVRTPDSPDVRAPDWIDREMALALAAAVVQYGVEPTDREFAAALFDAIASRYPIAQFGRRHQYRYVGALLDVRDHDRARKVLAAAGNLSDEERFELTLDVTNPFVGDGEIDPWLRTLNRAYGEAGLSPLAMSTESAIPFDRIRCETPYIVQDGPLITVVTTTFRPDHTLLASVGSILAQTWQNLELIIVDDASGPEYEDILEECVAVDDRIRLIRQPVNRGTYVARNAALDVARGEFITGQDSDDWSHPQRLERQIAPLLEDHSLVATRTRTYNITPELEFRTYRGRTLGIYYPSLMFRADLVRKRLGYFDALRKAADGELMRRISAVFKRQVSTVGGPLTHRRVNRGTLSYAEIGPSWVAPTRAAYWSAYRQWHRELARGTGGSPYVAASVRAPFPAPRAFHIDEHSKASARQAYDVVFVMDFAWLNASQRSALHEALALASAGYRVGVTHLESVFDLRARHHLLADECQAAINRGVIDDVLLEEAVDVDVVIVRDPDILEFLPIDRPRWRANRVLIYADHPPYLLEGLDHRYNVAHSTAFAGHFFGIEPEWVPASPVIRHQLEQHANASTIVVPKVAGIDLPPVVSVGDWTLPRPSSATLPVIGRHSGDSPALWSSSAEELHAIYADPGVEVRIWGNAAAPLKTMQISHSPVNWVCFGRYHLSTRSFLQQLDFYVHFPDTRIRPHFSLHVLEAMAAQRVVILPPEFEVLYGAGAVYASASEVRDAVAAYHSNRSRYDEQRLRAAEFVVRTFTAQRFTAAFDRLRAKNTGN
jgi:glycosyltransferase involved in cell wall biosynthesis